MRDHKQLLVILLAEDGEICLRVDEELCHDSGHAIEEMRAELVFKSGLGGAIQGAPWWQNPAG